MGDYSTRGQSFKSTCHVTVDRGIQKKFITKQCKKWWGGEEGGGSIVLEGCLNQLT